jgi:hypothetical protein
MYDDIVCDVTRIKFAREGASVLRTHTQSGIGPHFVGMHTFNMITMLKILHPNPSINLVWAVMEHDIPERMTGDIPHPAKKAGLVNHDQQSAFEKHLKIAVFGEDHLSQLSEEDLKWLNGLDMLEFYCWCKDQIMMGNRMMERKLHAVENYMEQYKFMYPEKIVDTYYAIRSHNWQTMSDIGG